MAEWLCSVCTTVNTSANPVCSNKACMRKASVWGTTRLTKFVGKSKMEHEMKTSGTCCMEEMGGSPLAGGNGKDNVQVVLAVCDEFQESGGTGIVKRCTGTPPRHATNAKLKAHANGIMMPAAKKPSTRLVVRRAAKYRLAKPLPDAPKRTLKEFADFAGVTCSDIKDVMLFMALEEDNFFDQM